MRPTRWLWLVTVLMLLLSGIATAEPQPISLDAYKARLQQIAALVARGEALAARDLANGTWQVATPKGIIIVDLSPLRPALTEAAGSGPKRDEALRLIGDQIQATDALSAAPTFDTTNARRRLDQALQSTTTHNRFWDSFVRWLARIFQRAKPAANGVSAASATVAPFLRWGALLVGVVGLALLGRSLTRSLSNQAGGENTTLPEPYIRPDRPLLPAELRAAADRAASAGDYKAALRLAHRAFLLHYDEIGLVRYMPAQTNREHERLVHRKFPVLARTAHILHNLIENRLYSGRIATNDDYVQADLLIQQLWREGDAASKSAQATTGASSSAPSP